MLKNHKKEAWSQILTGIVFFLISIFLYWYFLDFEKTGGVRKVNVIIATLYNIGGKTLPSIVIFIIGIIFCYDGIKTYHKKPEKKRKTSFSDTEVKKQKALEPNNYNISSRDDIKNHLISTYFKEAVIAEEKQDLFSAINKYKEIVRIKNSDAIAEQKIEELKEKLLNQTHNYLTLKQWQNASTYALKLKVLFPKDHQVQKINELNESRQTFLGKIPLWTYPFCGFVILMLFSLFLLRQFLAIDKNWIHYESKRHKLINIIESDIKYQKWGKALDNLFVLHNYCNLEEKINVDKDISIIKTFQNAQDKEMEDKWSEALSLYQNIYQQNQAIIKEVAKKEIERLEKYIQKYQEFENIQKVNLNSSEYTTLKYEEHENGFYKIYTEKHEPQLLYTWKFENDNIYCGNNIYYKFSKSGQQKIQLTISDGETKKTTETIISIPEEHVDKDLRDREKVYGFLNKNYKNNSIMLENKYISFSEKILNISLAFGGAYLVIQIDNSKRLKVYNLLQHTFENDLILTDTGCLYTFGGKYFVSYSKSQQTLFFYDFISKEEKKYPYKNIINIVMGLDNGTKAFVVIEDKSYDFKYALFDVPSFKMNFLMCDKRLFHSMDKSEWYSDYYLYNLSYYARSSKGINSLSVTNKSLKFNYQHREYHDAHAFSSDGRYILTSKGKIVLGNLENIIKNEEIFIAPIQGSSLYLSCKNVKINYDKYDLYIKDITTFKNIKKIADSKFKKKYLFTKHHLLASAIGDCMIQVHKDENVISIHPLGIRD